jgi:uncharacterized damage-inducible protein DinB
MKMRHAIVAMVVGLVAAGATSARAQGSSTPVSITAPLEQQFAGDLTLLREKVVALAKAIPADKYSWKPAAEVRTVSQVLMHMVGEWFYLCPQAVASKAPADFGAPGEKFRALELVTEKNEVIAQLDKAWIHCRTALDRIDPSKLVPDSLPAKMGFPRVVLLVTGDQHEHLGQLIAYARSLGITPPWSK